MIIAIAQAERERKRRQRAKRKEVATGVLANPCAVLQEAAVPPDQGEAGMADSTAYAERLSLAVEAWSAAADTDPVPAARRRTKQSVAAQVGVPHA